MITRRIDEQGRICIPKQYREHIGIEFNDEVELELDHNTIKILGAKHKCILCSSTTENKIAGKYICKSCVVLINDNIRT